MPARAGEDHRTSMIECSVDWEIPTMLTSLVLTTTFDDFSTIRWLSLFTVAVTAAWIGADTDRVLEERGFSSEEIRALRDSGAVGG